MADSGSAKRGSDAERPERPEASEGKEWPDKIRFPSTIVVVSKRNSGKSVLLQELLRHKLQQNEFDLLEIHSATVDFTDDYRPLLREAAEAGVEAWAGRFDLERVKALEARQRSPKAAKNAVLLLDDVVAALTARAPAGGGPSPREYIGNLTTYSRHIKLTQILSIQRAKSEYSTAMRENTDYLLVSDVGGDAARTLSGVAGRDIQPLLADLDRQKWEFLLYDSLERAGQPFSYVSVRAPPVPRRGPEGGKASEAKARIEPDAPLAGQPAVVERPRSQPADERSQEKHLPRGRAAGRTHRKRDRSALPKVRELTAAQRAAAGRWFAEMRLPPRPGRQPSKQR